jgi:hypothetical protein
MMYSVCSGSSVMRYGKRVDCRALVKGYRREMGIPPAPLMGSTPCNSLSVIF